MTTAEDSLYSTLPSCPPYHPNSELQGREGYYPNVSPAQLKCVSNLAMRIRDSNLDISDEYEHEFLKLLRFCRARQFDVEKAFQMIQKNVEYVVNLLLTRYYYLIKTFLLL